MAPFVDQDNHAQDQHHADNRIHSVDLPRPFILRYAQVPAQPPRSPRVPIHNPAFDKVTPVYPEPRSDCALGPGAPGSLFYLGLGFLFSSFGTVTHDCALGVSLQFSVFQFLISIFDVRFPSQFGAPSFSTSSRATRRASSSAASTSSIVSNFTRGVRLNTRSITSGIPKNPSRLSKNAATATSSAAFSAQGHAPPFFIAFRASRKHGNLRVDAFSKSSRFSFFQSSATW